MNELTQKGKLAKAAAAKLASLKSDTKKQALLAVADALVKNTPYILEENQKDISNARANGMNDGLIDRLLITAERIDGIADGIRQIASLPDPIGEVISETKPSLTLEAIKKHEAIRDEFLGIKKVVERNRIGFK